MADSDARGQQGGRPKKRSRVISNLTEEQLQRKRNVDRNAQRAFRQRTKDSIYRLEQQIVGLQQTAAERETRLQHELSALRGTNTSLLQCLDDIAQLASATARSVTDMAAVVDAASHDDGDNGGNSDGHDDDDDDDDDDAHLDPAPNTPATPHTPHASRLASPSSHHSPHQLTDNAPGYPSPSASQQLATTTPEAGHFLPADFRLASHPLAHDRHPSIVLSPLPSDRTPTAASAYGALSAPSHPVQAPVFTVLPSHLPPTCPLDEILHDFLETRREMIVQGATPESVLGPPKPTVKALLNTTMAATVHPICAVMSEVLSTFPHVGQPEKLAFFYLMFKTMRWQICPTDESYSAMPSWLRPTVSQITVPHAAWIDNIPWPGVRDILIQEPQNHPFEVFSQYYSQNVTINWSFDPLDAVSDVDDQVVLHSIFEKHICSLKNWTVTPDFQRRFPAMTSAIYFRD